MRFKRFSSEVLVKKIGEQFISLNPSASVRHLCKCPVTIPTVASVRIATLILSIQSFKA